MGFSGCDLFVLDRTLYLSVNITFQNITYPDADTHHVIKQKIHNFFFQILGLVMTYELILLEGSN